MHFDKTITFWLFAVALSVGATGQAFGGDAEQVEFFEAHIRPVLVEKCYSCHSANAKVLKGGLRLDSAERMRTGGESGPVIVPNKPDASPLISALKYESNEMPPSGKLPDEVIHDFEKWIEMGAPDPRKDTPAAGDAKKVDPREHWAYRRPRKTAPPQVAHANVVRDELDAFVLEKLEASGLAPSAQASPRVLLRRVCYDLTGLPPTAEALEAFAADPSDARYEAVVEHLLTSPQYGERWGRYWLDVARYADTKGYVFTEDRSYKGAFVYRDWVIASFNADRPFDKFIVAQVASDQCDDPSSTAACGFLTLGRRFLNDQNDIINDRIDVVTRGVLGLTVACARCHDHKYDPIAAADYYALYGVFASSKEKPRDEAPPEMVDSENLYSPYVFLRGNAGNHGPNTERRFLNCLTPDNKAEAFKHGSGRRELADAITSRENPLTARVWVNRMWGHLFGKGIVDTPSDFGVRGTPPTHPELLDTLACEFMDDGWSTKRLVRRIVLSATYRQASDVRDDGVRVDPENHLLWRANRRRLDLESLRDSLLAAAGRLDEKVGGPSISITDAPFSTRRSVYGYIERQNLPAFFRTFDFANPNTHTPERLLTTVPQQALYLMNGPFAIEQASFLASRSEAGATPGERPAAAQVRRITRIYRYAVGREPSIDEVADALDFIDRGDSPAKQRVAHQLAWQYGFGAYDENAKKVTFQPLPRYIKTAWQGGEQLPDKTIGWVRLTASGGHPGDQAHAAIRRWVAPAAGNLSVDGVLMHPTGQGDGLRGRVISNRAGVVGSWDVFHKDEVTKVVALHVEAGDTVDFITDSRGGEDSDSFDWHVALRLASPNSMKGAERVWDSADDFHGRLPQPLTRWQEFAQVLLMSNEFAFVD